MCLVCGNIAEAQVASTNMLTLLIVLSPLWGIYAYRVLHWFSLETHAHRRWPIMRLGTLTALYALIAYIFFIVLMIGLVMYGTEWQTLYGWGLGYMIVVYFFLARSITQALPMKKRNILLIGAIHGVGYFLLSFVFLIFANTVDHNPEFTSWFIGFGWVFTSQLSIIAPPIIAGMLLVLRRKKIQS